VIHAALQAGQVAAAAPAVNVTEVITFATVFLSAVAVVRALADHWTRRKMIDARLSADEMAELWARDRAAARMDALRWGCVLVGAGAGLVLMPMLTVRWGSSAAYGVVVLLTGVAFLVFHAIASREDARPPRRPATRRAPGDPPDHA
jgi:hypothetical protein